jgi:hypothetical protein
VKGGIARVTRIARVARIANLGADLAGDEVRDGVVIEAFNRNPVHRDEHVVHRNLPRAAIGFGMEGVAEAIDNGSPVSDRFGSSI